MALQYARLPAPASKFEHIAILIMLNLLLVLSFMVAVTGMVRYKRLTMPFKILSLYFVFEILIILFDEWEIAKYKTNVIQLHIETSGTYIFFGLIYYFLFKSKYIKVLILASVILVIVFSLINSFFLQPYSTTFPTNTTLITEILYLIFAVLLFNKMLLYPTEINIIKQSTFWYNSAIILFYSSVFLYTTLANYYQAHKVSSYIIDYFAYGSIIIFDVLLGIAILTDNKEIPTANDAQLSFRDTE